MGISVLRSKSLTAFLAAIVLASLLVVPASAGAASFAPSAADDEVPGIPSLLPYAARDSLASTDVDDVVAVWLPEGAQLVVTMASAQGTQFGIALFPPDSASVANLADSVAGSQLNEQDPTSSVMTYEVPQAGTYYIDLYMRAGSADGEYAAVATLANFQVNRLKVPSTPKANKRFTISCYVAPVFNTETATLKFEVQKLTKGHWKKYHTFTAAADEGTYDSYCHVSLKGQGSSKLRVRAVFDDGFNKFKTSYKYFRFRK